MNKVDIFCVSFLFWIVVTFECFIIFKVNNLYHAIDGLAQQMVTK